jgi:Protein of unknown function (DUF3606)
LSEFPVRKTTWRIADSKRLLSLWQTTKAKEENRDRDRINVHEPYELKYWADKFGISQMRLRVLVSKHGVMVKNIKKAL